ncbi:MAG: hypothetical protein ABIG93_01440 [archaeon]
MNNRYLRQEEKEDFAAQLAAEVFGDATTSGSMYVGMIDCNIEGQPIGQHLESGSYTIKDTPDRLRLAPEDPNYLKALADRYDHLR